MKNLKNAILQLAIQGKLVPNNVDTNSCASVETLLAEIAKQKANLIAEGKLKKQKSLKPIEEKEIPFKIPENWRWVRLGEIAVLSDGEKQSGKQVLLDAKFLRGKSEAVYLENGKFVSKGENVILVDGENSGEVFYVSCDGYMGSTFKKLVVNNEVCLQYVLNFILLQKDLLRKSKTGSAIPHLNKDLFFNFLIPLPPLSVQRAIVAKVEELFASLESINL